MKTSIIEWTEIRDDNDLPPHGEYLVRYGDGTVVFRTWVPKTISFDWGWSDTDGDCCLPPRYYCKLKDIKDYNEKKTIKLHISDFNCPPQFQEAYIKEICEKKCRGN